MNLLAWRTEETFEGGGNDWPQRFAVSLCPETYDAVLAIREVEAQGNLGGNLHIHIEDWNLEDSDFLRPEAKSFGSPVTSVEARAYKLLRSMSEPERHTALAIADGYTLGEAYDRVAVRNRS
jgi:hypothetical protein